MDSKKMGAFISELRKENKLTQAALAEKLNISNRTISKWENGDGYPDITILPDLAGIFGITVDELLSGERAPQDVPDIKVTEIESKDNLLNLFHIAYIISLFFGIFGAILGVVTLAYSTWAFNILFYTHWEIMFVAVSFASLIVSGLVFAIGAVRLNVSFSADEVRHLVARKLWLVSLLIASLPSAFVVRIIDCSHRLHNATPLCLALVIVALVFAFGALWSRVKKY